MIGTGHWVNNYFGSSAEASTVNLFQKLTSAIILTAALRKLIRSFLFHNTGSGESSGRDHKLRVGVLIHISEDDNFTDFTLSLGE